VRKLVADTGPVVPPSNPDALAEAILFVLALSPADRKAAGQGARNRIRELFSIRSVAERYQALWDEVAIEGVPT
jgi:glycosyltransferase involved in cell wall biosynthesis